MECGELGIGKHHEVKKHEHSDRISVRRKALFPVDNDNNDSDLGPMSPLSDTCANFVCSLGQPIDQNRLQCYFSTLRETIHDYIIFKNDKNSAKCNEDNICTASQFGNVVASSQPTDVAASSPLYLSPIQNNLDSSTVLYETPIKDSPTKNLKTPHDTSSTVIKLPRIPRKTNSDLSTNVIDLDASNNSMNGASANKSTKLDTSCTKKPKVRTALFPESDMSLSVKSFYSNSVSNQHERSMRDYVSEVKVVKRKSKSAPIYLCSRKTTRRKRFGQINAGVRHSIRKPKQRKIPKSEILRTALKIIENSPLNNYLQQIESQHKQLRNDTNKLNNTLLSFSATKVGKIELKQETVNSKVVEKGDLLTATERDRSAKTDESNLPDPNKKFFKMTKMCGIVTVNKNIKLQVSKDHISLIKNTTKRRTRITQNRITLDASDLTVCESDQFELSENIADIINMLEADKENSSTSNNAIYQQRKTNESNSSSTSTGGNERKRKLLDPISESADLLLSPTSQMCDMASGLAINSPKRAKLNITKILDDTAEKSKNVFNKTSTSEIQQQKLFPVFYPSNKAQNKVVKINKIVEAKQWKLLPKDQMLLDAGQIRFGATQCPECKIVYHMGDPNDEIMHLNYHNAGNILRFNGWKHENVVATCKNGRIIKVSPSDSKVWWKKVNDLMEVINRDLGHYEINLELEKSTVFLYIKHKCVAGCLIAEPKTLGHMMLPNLDGIDTCSEESYPIKCGISRIWVSKGHRKQGIGTALLNCLRMNFILGHILRYEDIALSSPTEMGKMFALNYFKTPNYLIYLMA